MNKDIRKQLIESYLNAETSPEQEHLLAEWFATHGAGDDEKSVARLILAEYPEVSYDAGEKDFGLNGTPAILTGWRLRRASSRLWLWIWRMYQASRPIRRAAK